MLAEVRLKTPITVNNVLHETVWVGDNTVLGALYGYMPALSNPVKLKGFLGPGIGSIYNEPTSISINLICIHREIYADVEQS